MFTTLGGTFVFLYIKRWFGLVPFPKLSINQINSYALIDNNHLAGKNLRKYNFLQSSLN